MIAHLDCSTGVSGDKFLGALLDVGTQRGVFSASDLLELAGRMVPEARVRADTVMSRGVAALGVRVKAESEPGHRTWRDVRALIERAGLSAPVLESSLEVFSALAKAEASIHGCSPDDVHFHEVGALDSIIDVVGVCAAVFALGIERLTASEIATGWGVVSASHGSLPVPAPATALLLLGVPTRPGPAGPNGSDPGELTTPTGAALASVLVDGYGACPPMIARFVGHGAGTRDIGHPNVCRLTMGDPLTSTAETMAPSADECASERVSLLETNLDHLSPEAVSFASEELLAKGALDVWCTPVTMKKGRAAVVLSLLARPGDAGELTALVHRLTGSLGVRHHEITRSVVAREIVTLDSEWGPVRFKRGAGLTRPEHDDVARIARDTGRTYAEVASDLNALISRDAPAAGLGDEEPLG